MNDLQRMLIGLLVVIIGASLFIWGNWDHIPRWWELTVSADWPAILGMIGGCSAVFAAAYAASAWQDHKWAKKGKKPWEGK